MFLIMHRVIFLLSLFLLSYLNFGFAQDTASLSVPTPFIHGVNVITGQADNLNSSHVRYERYQIGWNQLREQSIFLSMTDYRIGKVKTIHLDSPEYSSNSSLVIHLSYENGATHVYETPQRLSIYRYSPNSLIHAVEHYEIEASGTSGSSRSAQLYRIERLFWQEAEPAPLLTSRVLEDKNGQAVLCHCFTYNEKGQLIKEMLAGQLSGDCKIPCKIGKDGYPIENGVETYCKTYIYSEKDPDLLLANIEDSGLKTTYQERQGQLTSKLSEGGDAVLKEENSLKERYNEYGECVATIDDYGNETTYTYDPFGRLASTQLPAVLDMWDHPYRPVQTQSYDICDQVTQITDTKGEKISIQYNIRGKPIEIIYPDGSIESFRYFLDGGLKEIKECDGTTITFTRDDACRIIRSEKHSASGTLLQKQEYSNFFEDAAGQLMTKVDHVDSNPSADFVFSQTSAAINSLGQSVKQEEKVDGYGIRHILTYDALERIESTIKYNAMGIKIAECQHRYDEHGNQVLEKHHVLIEGRRERTYTIRWNYDECKRLLSVAEGDQDQTKITRYRYRSDGKLEQVIKPDGSVLLYSYNEDGQLELFEASDHSFAYQYSYDHLHQLVAIHDLCHDIVQTRSYNAFHELIEDNLGTGLKVSHHYDSEGRSIGLTLPDMSTVAYHYEGPLLKKVERLNADGVSQYSHSYAYDADGRLQTCTLLKGVGDVDYRYNHKGRLSAIESPWWSQKIEENGFDPYGRIIAMKIQDRSGIHSSNFTYTDHGQLEEEEGHQYTYDSLFNRLSKDGRSWKVNSLNQLIKTPEASYRYDANGNLVEKCGEGENVFYSYDALDRLIRVEYPEKQALTYVYDSFHRRIEQKVWEWESHQKKWLLQTSERFIYDGFKEIGKVDEKDQIVELRILGKGQGADLGAAIALELHGKIFVPIHDIFGSVRCIIDANEGCVAENYRYSAYGQENLSDERGYSLEHSQIGNPWRFCSKRVDDRTGLVFFGKRDYDPTMGRWLTPDPLLFYDTPNLYAFDKNDPVNYSDLYGLFSMSQIWNSMVNTFFTCFKYLQMSAHNAKFKWNAELKLPPPVGKAFEKIGKILFGESTYLLLGPHFEETHVDCYGEHEINDKVRVTFINGILNTRTMMQQNLELISESHGGVKVHYVYRPTEGWTWDISRACFVKAVYSLVGVRTMHANLLAQMWRSLIQEMGGVNEGGTIIHYAHSLGGSETDRARELLTPEEQKMIRVITFGSATMIRNVGFQSVVNFVSVNDGVCLLDPIGRIRNILDPDRNVRFHGAYFGQFPLSDHLLNGSTYGPILKQLGEEFLSEFRVR